MKPIIFLASIIAITNVASAQNSSAKFVTGSSSTITSTAFNSPFRFEILSSTSTSNGYIDIGCLNTYWGHISTGNDRFIMNRPLFIKAYGAMSTTYSIISTYDGKDLSLGIGGTTFSGQTTSTFTKMFIKANGEIGIGTGTNTPAAKLQINGDLMLGNSTVGKRWWVNPRQSNNGDYLAFNFDDGSGVFSNNSLTLQRSNGGVAIANGTYFTNSMLHVITHTPVTGQSTPQNSALTLERRTDLTAGNTALGRWDIKLWENAVNSSYSDIYITSDLGNVFKLTPQGDAVLGNKLTCKEVVVTSTISWADFVFASDYKLKPLSEVEQFIKSEKHLPGIPTESEIKENGGADLGKTSVQLLQKVEELTLYVIELEKRINELENSTAKTSKQ